jgi:hypothetical protein
MHMRITIVLVELIFSSCRRFQNGTKSSDEATESAHGEECLWRTSVSERHERYIAAQKVRLQKLPVKTMLTAFFC